MKEADSSTNAVLNNLFCPMTRKRVKELGIGDEEEARYVERLSREVDCTGKESTIAIGTAASRMKSVTHLSFRHIRLFCALCHPSPA